MKALTTPIQREWFEYINLCDQVKQVDEQLLSLENSGTFVPFFELMGLEIKLNHLESLLNRYKN